MDIAELAAPLETFGRQGQFQQITQALARDRDLLIAGVPGSGRRTLVRRAATEVGAKIIEVDCIRATDGQRLTQLLCEGISQAVKSPIAIECLQQWISKEAAEFFCLARKYAKKFAVNCETGRSVASLSIINSFSATISGICGATSGVNFARFSPYSLLGSTGRLGKIIASRNSTAKFCELCFNRHFSRN
jgi:hypothetical protein